MTVFAHVDARESIGTTRRVDIIGFPVSSRRGPVLKSELLRLLQQEIRKHDFSYFVENPPSVAQGGNGVVVPGCPTCRARINTMPQFLDHLTNEVLPTFIANLKPGAPPSTEQ